MLRDMYLIKSSFLLVLFLSVLLSVPLSAQSDNLRVSVANLSQDMSQLVQQVKTLRLEIEQMHSDNKQLRAQLAAATSNRQTDAQISSLSSAIDTLRREYQAADADQKKQILLEMNRQMKAFASETQSAINAVAEAVDSEPQVATPVSFPSDYPKTGITYSVRSGDTLSKIARDHGSTTKHIQNANKIVNPSKDLQVGQTIFIPIAQ
jgi:LysM repeat protein